MKWLRILLQVVGAIAILVVVIRMIDSTLFRSYLDLEVQLQGPPAKEAVWIACHSRYTLAATSTGFKGRWPLTCDDGGVVLIKYADGTSIPCDVGYRVFGFENPGVQRQEFRVSGERRQCVGSRSES
jgi:hypothetical protein